MKWGLAACATVLMACAQPAAARDVTEPTVGLPITTADGDDMEVGDYIWRPDLAPPGPVRIVVDLDGQMAYVYRREVLIGITTISSGMEGHETPVGTFQVLQKQVTHRSNKYNSAPMPYMQRLTWSGVALHAGSVSRDSHGCIHLPSAFARRLYGVTSLSTIVEIGNGVPLQGYDGQIAGGDTAEKAPSG